MAPVGQPVGAEPDTPPRGPIGAPPPAAHPASGPGLLALSRQSEESFEDAVAASQSEAAAREAEAKPAADPIFTYQPPAREGTQTRPSAIRSAILGEPEVRAAVASEKEAVSQSETQSSATSSLVDKAAPLLKKLPALPEGFPLPRRTRTPVDTKPVTQTEKPAPDTPIPPSHPAHTEGAEAEAAPLEPDVTETDAPPVDEPLEAKPQNSAPDPVPLPEEPELTTPDSTNAIEQRLSELQRAFETLETRVAATEENIRSDVAPIAQQIDDLKKETAQQISNVTETLTSRMDQRLDSAISELAKDSEKREHANRQFLENEVARATAGMATVANPRVRTAEPPAMQLADPSPDHTTQPHDNDTHRSKPGRTVMERLAPVGEVIARKFPGNNIAKATETAATDKASRTSAALDADRPPAQARHELDALTPPQQDRNEQDGPTYLTDEDLASQSVSNLRRSLFASLRERTPNALAVIGGIVAILTTALVLSLIYSGDPSTDQVTATKPVRQPEASASSRAGGDVTTSETTHIETEGEVAPTAASPENESDITGTTTPLSPATLKPAAPDATASIGGLSDKSSKLELPPLATGPLSLRLAAANGDPDAQFDVAARLAQGNGVTRDPVAAVKWYTRAASSGHPQAQYRLAALYERGTGVATDTGRAKVWYTRAAQQGNVKAMHNLAVLYAGQASGSPNYVNAAQWFERAANHNLADSQFNVAILYMNGLGVQKDLQTAHKWFALAAGQGDSEARRRIKGVERLLKPAELRAARKRAKDWTPKPVKPEANIVTAWRPKANATSSSRAPQKTALTPTPTEAPSPSAVNESDIAKTQRLLNGLGFEAGKPTGTMDAKTKKAIKSFQTRNGMVPTGIVDSTLIKRIEGATREKAAKLGLL
ncbi:MAG: peptidoglycan-binding protein [Pseudomonadota bacterium]